MLRRLVGSGAVLLGLALVLTACGSSPPPEPVSIGQPMNAALPASIERIPLVDSTGHARDLAGFKGRILVLQDTMTLCQETCPLDTAALLRAAAAADAAGFGKKIEFVSLTVDPVRDVPAQLAAYKKLYGGPSNWMMLTGKPADVDAIWHELGVYHKQVPSSGVRNWRTGAPLTYDIQHADELFFFDPSGHERFIIDGMPDAHGRKGIPSKIYDFLSPTGRGNAEPGRGDWTDGQARQVLSWLVGKTI